MQMELVTLEPGNVGIKWTSYPNTSQHCRPLRRQGPRWQLWHLGADGSHAVWAGGRVLGVSNEASWGPHRGSPGLGTGSGQGGLLSTNLEKSGLEEQAQGHWKRKILLINWNRPLGYAIYFHNTSHAWKGEIFPFLFCFITVLLKYNSHTIYFTHLKGTPTISLRTFQLSQK